MFENLEKLVHILNENLSYLLTLIQISTLLFMFSTFQAIETDLF